MSDIHFECPRCEQTLAAPEELASQLIECPACKETIEVPIRNRSPKKLVTAPPVIAEEHLYFANNKRWRECPVSVYQGILEVADGRRIATRSISSKEIVVQKYSKTEVQIRNLTTTEKALRFAGWILCPLGWCSFVIICALGIESTSTRVAAGVALLAAVVGLILSLSITKTRRLQRWGSLYHLTITYPGCDQYIQTASSLMSFYGSNVGLGIIGTSGKLTSGDIIFSSTDLQAVARLSEDIEKDLRREAHE